MTRLQRIGALYVHENGLGPILSEIVDAATLPLPTTEAPQARSVERRDAPARLVLVIEDNADGAETLADVLALDGHVVQVAHSGGEGVALAREHRPDVILCDIGLPDIDGYEVARQVRAIPGLEGVRLVALTGHAQPEDHDRAKDAGFDAHLAKPPSPEVLARAVSPESEPAPSTRCAAERQA